MNELSKLTPPKGAVKNKKRIGRGRGSGHGTTATKGTKGEKARSGVSLRPWFEGGQMPLQRRIPKRGFRNPFKKQYSIVNVSALEKFEDETYINVLLLKEKGIVRKIGDGIKILGKGEVTKKLKVCVHAISKSAKKKIESAGGSVELINL